MSPKNSLRCGVPHIRSSVSCAAGARLVLVAAALSMTAASAAGAENITLETLLREMVDRDALARLPAVSYAAGLASSYDRRSVAPDQPGWFANDDNNQYIRVEQNQGRTEYVLMDVAGPGAITRFWKGGVDPNKILRIYLDGGSTPVIEEKMEDFLGGRLWAGTPFAMISGRGFNSYVPLPYSTGCKVTCEAAPDWYNIEYRKFPAGTPTTSFTKGDYLAAGPLLGEVGAKLNDAKTALMGVTRWLPSQSNTLAQNQSIRTATSGASGCIRSLSVEVQSSDMAASLRALRLNISFDGQQTVSCPVGDFFGSGVGLNPYKDWAFQVEKTGTNKGRLTCYFVMPFQKECSVELVNTGTQTVSATLDRIGLGDWQWDDRSMHFHASFRSQNGIQTKRQDGTMDWNYVTIQGKGVYVGDTLAIRNGSSAWWGEGDEKIFVDGEAFPSFFGTGTEDFYGYSYGDASFFEAPFHAQPRYEGNNTAGCRTTNTRIRALDAIPFSESLKVDLEIWHWAATSVDYAATSYWYQLPAAQVPEPNSSALLFVGMIAFISYFSHVCRKR